MARDRPYRDLSGPELTDLFAHQLQAGDKVYGKPGVPYLENAKPPQNVETVFRIGPDGRPEAVTRLVDFPAEGSLRNVGESELAWLHRRVAEITNWRV